MPDPDPTIAWQRLLSAASKVVEAGDALDDAGGLHRLAATWRPGVRDKAKAALIEAKKVIDAQLGLLKAGPPGA